MAGGDYNIRGRYYEVLFKAECLKRELTVLSPECAHLPFDVAIFSMGKFKTVQIKGASTIRQAAGKGREIRFQSSGSSCRASYFEKGVDFMALYTVPTLTWYILPTALVTAKTIGIRLGPTSHWNQWKERWDLLGAPLVLE